MSNADSGRDANISIQNVFSSAIAKDQVETSRVVNNEDRSIASLRLVLRWTWHEASFVTTAYAACFVGSVPLWHVNVLAMLVSLVVMNWLVRCSRTRTKRNRTWVNEELVSVLSDAVRLSRFLENMDLRRCCWYVFLDHHLSNRCSQDAHTSIWMQQKLRPIHDGHHQNRRLETLLSPRTKISSLFD